MSKIFKKLSKRILTIDHYNTFVDNLILKVKNNEHISNNPMIDGMMIGWLVKNRKLFSTLVLTENDLGRLMDSTIQQCEQVTLWILNNEDKLCEL